MLLDHWEQALAKHHLLLVNRHASELSSEVVLGGRSRRGLRRGWLRRGWLRRRRLCRPIPAPATATLGTLATLLRAGWLPALAVLASLALALGPGYHVALGSVALELTLLATLPTLLWKAARPTHLAAHLWLVVHLATATSRHRIENTGSLGRVHARHATRGVLHAGLLHTLSHLGLELSTALLLALSEGDIDWLRGENLAVHFSDSLGGFLWGVVANKAKALGGTVVSTHDLARGDLSIRIEGSAESLIIKVLVEVLDIEVDTLVFVDALLLDLVELLFELGSAFALLLGA